MKLGQHPMVLPSLSTTQLLNQTKLFQVLVSNSFVQGEEA